MLLTLGAERVFLFRVLAIYCLKPLVASCFEAKRKRPLARRLCSLARRRQMGRVTHFPSFLKIFPIVD
jgi:hypothetical protein